MGLEVLNSLVLADSLGIDNRALRMLRNILQSETRLGKSFTGIIVPAFRCDGWQFAGLN